MTKNMNVFNTKAVCGGMAAGSDPATAGVLSIKKIKAVGVRILTDIFGSMTIDLRGDKSASIRGNEGLQGKDYAKAGRFW